MKALRPTEWSGRRRLIVILTILFITLAVWISLPKSEPSYQGVPASDYVKSVLSSNSFTFNGMVATNHHLGPLGTAIAVTAIAKVLAQEDARWKHWYRAILPHAPIWLRKRLTPPQFDEILIMNCATALGTYGPEAKPAVKTLANSFDQANEMLQWHIATQLSRLGPDARAAIPSLLDCATRTGPGALHTQTRTAAIRVLAKVDPRGKASAHKLVTFLADSDMSVVIEAIDTLGYMARQSYSLVPLLRNGLQHSELQVCLIASGHLKRLRALNRQDVEPFLQKLESSDPTNRVLGATVLRYAQSAESEVMPALLEAMSDTNAQVRQATATSLFEFAKDSDVSRPNRVAAAKVVLQHGSTDQSWPMMDLLPQWLPEAGDVVPLLIAALYHDNERIRGKAALTLGKLGSLAKDATPALMKLRTDEWQNVREVATNALNAIHAGLP